MIYLPQRQVHEKDDGLKIAYKTRKIEKVCTIASIDEDEIDTSATVEKIVQFHNIILEDTIHQRTLVNVNTQ